MNEARALRDKVLRVNAHVIVLKSQMLFADYREATKTVEAVDGVVAVEPFLFLELLIASAGHAPVRFAMKGVDPQRVGSALDLAPLLKAGRLQDLASGAPPAIVLGDALASALGVHLGNVVVVKVPPHIGSAGEQLRDHPFRVTGILHTDIAEYDEHLALASLSAAQEVEGGGDQVMGLEIRVKDLDRSDEIARAIEGALGGLPFEAKDWFELNRGMFGGCRP